MRIVRSTWRETRIAVLLCFVAVQLPELHMLAKVLPLDISVTYFVLTELSKAALCLALGLYVHPALKMFALWFVAQAVDEVLNGNLFFAGLWEYLALVVLLYTVWKHIKTK